MAVIPAVNREFEMSTPSHAVQLFNAAKADITRSRKSLTKYADQFQKHRKQMLHIVKMVAPVDIGDRWDDKQYSITTRVDATYCQPQISFYLHNLDGFKDERLEAVLWYLSTLDGSREPKSTEYPQSLNRVYRFEFDGFDVRVDAVVRSDSPVCRKVVISSELVKQDKYAIQCD
jgi:hypothetical protein